MWWLIADAQSELAPFPSGFGPVIYSGWLGLSILINVNPQGQKDLEYTMEMLYFLLDWFLGFQTQLFHWYQRLQNNSEVLDF